MKTSLLAGVLILLSPAAHADEQTDAFVEGNLIAVLYHELGHALIDIMALPVFGQEEDAADVLSVLLIDALFEEDSAVSLTYEAAFGFLGEADAMAAEGGEPAYWDVHGADLQRYYNLVCLFYGANPEEREDVAADLDLPQERADSCEEEFELAADSWGAVLGDLEVGAPGETLQFEAADPDSLTARTVRDEVAALNESFALPESLSITVESCGEPNAFYNPEAKQITICAEFEERLRSLAPAE
ncbi:DUF4344 domain-containing metallopeptidase [Aliiroseovarius sp. YM-037]|uniref:DUF4344 domain-containing metallopeptidase n=1 Tax=Aliiroseovarius sp. YM-037 TaxID=3341728 RepID=UPI003A7F6D70